MAIKADLRVCFFLMVAAGLSVAGCTLTPLTVDRIPLAPSFATAPSRIPWRPFSLQELNAHRQTNKPVLVNFRANWDLLTTMHEHVALETPPVRHLIWSKGAIPLIAECGEMSEAELEALTTLGVTEIPTVLVYPANASAQPIVIRDVISERDVIAALRSVLN